VTRLGQFYPTGTAVEEANPQLLFELPDQQTQPRLGDVDLFGRPGKGAMTSHGQKGPQLTEVDIYILHV
jgi:hypothetical protein